MNRSKETTKELSLDSLKGMQSVRATFTLPKKTITLLSTVANQLGVKQKSIFDRLAENKVMLHEVADEAQKNKEVTRKRRQKTFVLSSPGSDGPNAHYLRIPGKVEWIKSFAFHDLIKILNGGGAGKG